ncbi:MAG: site-specific integrase [Lachnospiraceae bacterium]|nr:site-specific integrase [Lachnospiraceae bacterium]
MISEEKSKMENFNDRKKAINEAYKHGIISPEDAKAELKDLADKRYTYKLNKVLSVHPNRISGSKPDKNGAYTIYRTRAKWASSGMISKKSYKELIEELYAHYFGDLIVHDDITFEESFYSFVKGRLKADAITFNSSRHYIDDYEKYIKGEEFAQKPIVKVKKSELIDFYERVVGNGKITSHCFGNIKSCINGAFKYVSKFDGIETIDPKNIDTSDISRKCKRVENSEKVYSVENRDKLLTYLEGLDEQTVYTLGVRLAFCLPTRIGELTAIAWEDVNFETKQIIISHSMVTVRTDKVNCKLVRVDYLKAHSKAGKRVLDLSDYAIEVLKELKLITGDKFYVLNSAGENPITENNFNQHLKKYCEACGVTYLSSHKIRFYHCSRMYELGVDEKAIQSAMGHSDIGMTRHYDRRKEKRFTNEEANAVFGR